MNYCSNNRCICGCIIAAFTSENSAALQCEGKKSVGQCSGRFYRIEVFVKT